MKTGDVVQLKSGGVLMTVIEIRREHGKEIVCAWLTDRSELEVWAFPKKALVLVQDE